MSRVIEWEIERVREWERVKEWQWENVRVTFEHRHENKSCSACPEWVNERVQVCKSLQPCNLDMKSIIRHVDRLKEWESVRVFSPINSYFWAWTWKQNLFSMLIVSEWESVRVFSPINSDFWAWTWKQKLFGMLILSECESDRVRVWVREGESEWVWVSDIDFWA